MTADFTLTVAATAASVGETRRAVAAWASFMPEPQQVDLSIAVSELVGNAVIHGPGDGQVVTVVRRGSRLIDVSVYDEGARTLIAVREPDERGGRGLRIVEKLSVSWGVEYAPTTRVWFTMLAAPST
jgi:anti-sigma regulatory factor (Ser/Thr protein kinase)